MKLTKAFHIHTGLAQYSKSLPPLTVVGELLHFRCSSSGRSFRGLPPEKENKPLICFPANGSQRASQRPPGGCPATPAPRTRMFGLENDFATPSAPFSNCPKGNYLVSLPLKKNQEPYCYCIK